MWAKFNTLRAQQRTREAGFHDPHSRIGFRPDGSEFWKLAGVDVGIMRNRVFVRDLMICQHCRMHLALAECEMDHIRSRGKGGDDSLGNLQTLGGPTACGCHRKKHLRPRWTSGERMVRNAMNLPA